MREQMLHLSTIPTSGECWVTVSCYYLIIRFNDLKMIIIWFPDLCEHKWYANTLKNLKKNVALISYDILILRWMHNKCININTTFLWYGAHLSTYNLLSVCRSVLSVLSLFFYKFIFQSKLRSVYSKLLVLVNIWCIIWTWFFFYEY